MRFAYGAAWRAFFGLGTKPIEPTHPEIEVLAELPHRNAAE